MYIDVKPLLFKPTVPITLSIFFAVLFFWQISTIFTYNNYKPPKMKDTELTNIKISPAEFTVKAPFFGDYVPVNLKETDIKQSMLDLEVVGIIFAADKKESHIIVQSTSGNEKTLFIGDALPDGSIIKRITPEGILIGENGNLESLSLPKNELIFEPPAKPLIGE